MAQDTQETYHSFVDFLEYDIDGIGFIVPQRHYVPRPPSSHAEGHWKACIINFNTGSGRLGIRLRDALQLSSTHSKTPPLELPPEAFSAQGLPIINDHAFSIRIMWPGYKPYESDHSTCLYKLEDGDDMKRLMTHIARVVVQFFDNPPERVEGQWNGWDNLQKFKDNQKKVYLLRLVRVSALLWQPVFAIADGVFIS